MATAALDTVTKWSPYYVVAGRKWGIPASVLAAQVHLESGGQEGLTSSAGARGLTQFMPGTAASYDVDVTPGHAESQIDGAAHYLHDLGFSADPRKAIASYAAGPGNYTAGLDYADKLLALAGSTYKDIDADGRNRLQDSLDETTNHADDIVKAPLNAAAKAAVAAIEAVGNAIWGAVGDQGKYAALLVVLVLAGVTLVGLGTTRALGGRVNPSTLGATA